MRRYSARLFLSFLTLGAVVVTTGCKKEYPSYDEMREEHRRQVKPILDKHRTVATAKIEAIQSCAKDAKDAPPVVEPEPTKQPITTPENKDELEQSGILLANLEWAMTVDGTNGASIDYPTELPVYLLAAALKDGHAYDRGYSVENIDEQFGKLQNMKQLMVVRIRDYTPPKPVFLGGEQRFEGAKAIGDVLIYDLDAKQRIGGFPYEAVQDHTAKIKRGASDDEARKDLERYFTTDFKYAIRNELAAYAQGKSGPAAPGVADYESLRGFGERIRSQIAMEFLLAGARKVDVTTGDDGKAVVTIHAESPELLVRKSGALVPGLSELVEKALGRPATVKVVAVEKKTVD